MIFNDTGSIIAEAQSEVAEKRTDAITGHRSLFSQKDLKPMKSSLHSIGMMYSLHQRI